jgi:SAM-dependent methyltransferase
VPFDFAAAYEQLNPDDADFAFYIDLASRVSATRAIDLGCGTGVLAVGLARSGLEVIGVDPNPDMLRVARQRPAADRVDWRLGYADSMPSDWADLLTMSGHVSQVFTTDAAWQQVLTEAHRSLRAGGTLAFEMRNPAARAWERWTRDQTLRTIPTDAGQVDFWHDATSVDLPLVTYATTTHNTLTGESTTDLDTLAFREQVDLRASLQAAHFVAIDIFGGWDRTEVDAHSPELVVIARRAEPPGTDAPSVT